MRSLIIIALGVIIALLTNYLLPKKFLIVAGIIFTLVWLCSVLFNLRIGLSHGYSLAEELPIHLALFGIPVIIFWLFFYFSKH